MGYVDLGAMAMDKQQYLEEKKQIENKYKEALFNLDKDFAFSNNEVKVGDIVKSDLGEIIHVERIRHFRLFRSDFPECVYSGLELTKKMVPRKDERRTRVYQSRVREVIKI